MECTQIAVKNLRISVWLTKGEEIQVFKEYKVEDLSKDQNIQDYLGQPNKYGAMRNQ